MFNFLLAYLHVFKGFLLACILFAIFPLQLSLGFAQFRIFFCFASVHLVWPGNPREFFWLTSRFPMCSQYISGYLGPDSEITSRKICAIRPSSSPLTPPPPPPLLPPSCSSLPLPPPSFPPPLFANPPTPPSLYYYTL